MRGIRDESMSIVLLLILRSVIIPVKELGYHQLEMVIFIKNSNLLLTFIESVMIAIREFVDWPEGFVIISPSSLKFLLDY